MPGSACPCLVVLPARLPGELGPVLCIKSINLLGKHSQGQGSVCLSVRGIACGVSGSPGAADFQWGLLGAPCSPGIVGLWDGVAGRILPGQAVGLPQGTEGCRSGWWCCVHPAPSLPLAPAVVLLPQTLGPGQAACRYGQEDSAYLPELL